MANRSPLNDLFLQWKIIKLGEGKIAIQSKSSGGYLDGRAYSGQ
jgi:hypothetical protein